MGAELFDGAQRVRLPPALRPDVSRAWRCGNAPPLEARAAHIEAASLSSDMSSTQVCIQRRFLWSYIDGSPHDELQRTGRDPKAGKDLGSILGTWQIR